MLWPETTRRTDLGELSVGGVPLADLADEFGTPLYVFDEVTLGKRADSVLAAVRGTDGHAEAVFAAKALSIPAVLSLLHEMGLGIDVVSGGELHAALQAGVAPGSITFHGNNKDEEELRAAIQAPVGLIVVDNFHEFDILERLPANRAMPQQVLIRLNPGIDVHTHGKIATGIIDSKFGFPLWNGDATAAVERALTIKRVSLAGYHVHLGSQLFDLQAPVLAARLMIDFAAAVHQRTGVAPRVVSAGGGMGIAYDGETVEVNMQEWVERTVEAINARCTRHNLPLPTVVFEPGRSLVGQAGVAVYRVGSRKEIQGVRTYVSVDGGMADNIRPTLYDARYTAELANRQGDQEDQETVTIAGKYCESGDVLIEDIRLPRLLPGDLLALPAAGAYCIPLASNYNMSLRPAVVMVNESKPTLIRRRETFYDLLATSVM